MVAETRPDSVFQILGSELSSFGLPRFMVVVIYGNVTRVSSTLVPHVVMIYGLV